MSTPANDIMPDSALTPKKSLNIREQLIISSFWFATNLHWGALLLIIIPAQAKQIAPHNPAGAQAKILAAGAMIALIVPLIVGSLSDRSTSKWGRRRPFMAAGVAINLIGLIGMWYAGSTLNFMFYLLSFLVVQFGNNIAGAAYNGIIPDMVPPKQHGEASGYMATMTQGGMILGAFGSGYLMGKGYATASYIADGVILTLFLILSIIGIREKPLEVEPPPFRLDAFIDGLIEPLRHRDFMWVWITRALVTMGMWCVQPFIQNYLTDVVGEKNAAGMAGMLLAVILFMATLTGLIGGKISDVIGRKKVVYVANTVIAICSVAFVFSHSLLYTFIVGAVYGLGYGAYFSVDWALGCDVLPNQEDAGKDLGVWHISMVLPQALAPALAGWMLGAIGKIQIIDGVRHYSLLSYQATFSTGAFFLLLGAVLLTNVRERKDRERLAMEAKLAEG